MIKLLIVDDEQEIREGIRFGIDWEKNDITVIGEASNGTEAISIINNTFPDIVLVDIRMPEMNGLQLMEAISSSHPYIKPIILSGYEDFEYARKGLKLGAVDYLLKPCRPSEILNSVLTAKNMIEIENNQKNTLAKYESESKELLPVLKAKYLSALISSTKPDDSLLKKIQFVKFDIELQNLIVFVIRYDRLQNSLDINNNDNIQDTLINIIKETISIDCKCECFDSNGDIVAILSGPCDIDICKAIADKIKEVVKNTLKASLSIGISNTCDDISNINKAYKEALHAVEFKFFFGDNSTVLFNEIKNQYNNNKSYPIDLEKQLLNCIKAGDDAKALKKADVFFSNLESNSNNKSFIMKSYHSLLFSLYQLCTDNNTPVDEILEQLLESDDDYSLSTLDRLKKKIDELIVSTTNNIKDNKINNKLIEATLNYINENYNKDIRLDIVAKNLYITPSYLSLLFKQVLGINFVDYLHKIRLNKACELLHDPKLRSYEIAYMVGYNDDKYFSQIFKKHLGLTPSQYRDTMI